ncbi:MAG: AAA family ATPase [Desulfobacteraceae bacterium]|nr:AAA family ATPase [Desulfobacteraceae bacterium]
MPHIISIGGGKGGTGKSFITANLGVLLASQARKVLLVDLDLGASNLHTLLGVRNPKPGLSEFLNKTTRDLDHVIVPTMFENLFFINSMKCTLEIANLSYAQKLKLIRAIRNLPHDYILLDLGAGTNFNTLDFFLASNEGFLILTPSPTSIENTFRFIKAAHLRKLKQILKRHVVDAILKEIDNNFKGELITIPDLIGVLIKHDPDQWKSVQNTFNGFHFRLILNQFDKYTDVTLGGRIEKVCNKYFYCSFRFLGNVGYDSRVQDSILSRRVYISKYPYTSTAIELQNIAKQIVGNGQDPVQLSSGMS